MARDVRGFPLIKMTALRRAWSVKRDRKSVV